jgi:uncharacterized damage-inducible protein DinB
MELTLIRELYDYHRWANHRLFDVGVGLGDAVTRDMGKHWSVPTVKGMFAHLYAADALWLARWKGTSPSRVPGDTDFTSMADLRARWNLLETEQREFIEGLGGADLERPVVYKTTSGEQLQLPLAPSLQHVVNHATHHRSELATMITLISSSPPDTGINTYRTTILKG